MATEMLTWARRQVFQQFDLSSSERFVLMLLADNASWDEEDGHWHARPFQETLAKESGLSKRSVMRALSRLTEHGLISTYRRRRKSGFLGGNGYIFHPEAVEQPITLTEQNRVIPGSDTVSPLETAGGDTVSPTSTDPRDPRRRHSVTSAKETQGRRHSVTSEVTPATPPAREVNARASLNHHHEPSSSSSSSAGAFTVVSVGQPAAGAADDDRIDDDHQAAAEIAAGSAVAAAGAEPSAATPPSPADTEGAPQPDSGEAMGGAATVSGQMAGPAAGVAGASGPVATVGADGVHRGVDVAVVANQVAAAIGRRASSADIRWLVDQVLDRAKTRVQRPTPYVVAAVTADPAGWAAQLSSIPAAAKAELAGAAGHNEQEAAAAVAGHVTGQAATAMAGGDRPGCPVDDHASFGHRKGRCPMCRSNAISEGWKTEYDRGQMTRAKFEKLSAEAQQAVGKQGIEISG
ncbi:helix-turn-helix domain-containing protein [Nesterenkonia halobia]|uniref:Helix-turn-helix domain-containing protein n=1 Tax=Nesterenkonia halobia TaxID=37922 RepID=A0ABP6R837_9MICC